MKKASDILRKCFFEIKEQSHGFFIAKKNAMGLKIVIRKNIDGYKFWCSEPSGFKLMTETYTVLKFVTMLEISIERVQGLARVFDKSNLYLSKRMLDIESELIKILECATGEIE